MVLYFPFYLLLIILIAPLSAIINARVYDFILSYPGVAALYFALVSSPLTIFFGQSAGQMLSGIHVVRYNRDQTAPPQRAGPLRGIAHVAAFVVLFPIDWMPWVIRRTRMVHEVIAGTEVLATPRPAQVRVIGRGLVTCLGLAYFAYTLLLLAARWGDTATYVTVAVLWAIPIGVALWTVTAQRHPLFLSWSIAAICIGGPIPILWAVVAGKMQLAPYNAAKLWFVALFVIGFGVRVLHHTLRRR